MTRAPEGSSPANDCGINQLNLLAHKDVSEAQAFDVLFCLDWTAKRTAEAGLSYDKFRGTKKIDRLTYQIAQHNWPVGARPWMTKGTAPINTVNGKSLADYVTDVKTGCQ